jgi:hypothetical protein
MCFLSLLPELAVSELWVWIQILMVEHTSQEVLALDWGMLKDSSTRDQHSDLGINSCFSQKAW